MNIQIFGTKKCNDTKKAERFFKERGIKYQFIDMKEKGMSKGEFTSVAQANGGFENMQNGLPFCEKCIWIRQKLHLPAATADVPGPRLCPGCFC